MADTLPEGLAFPAGDANAGWTEVDGVVSTTIAGPLEPGAEVALALRLQVTADHGERLVNHAEI
ncbi:MAG: hypothetical protein KDA97_03165, partial [Acidimicrobiales bacterium]|nr:hypothetical protein [Acidimicrobiales bacterium]